MTAKKQRIIEYDHVKGISIFLVVLGHLVAGAYPAGHQWMETLKVLIYTFHMPLFMFLSGFILYYTYPGIHSWDAYKKYSLKKFNRLMPAFLIFALVIFTGKWLAGQVVHVDNPVASFNDFWTVFLTPYYSYSAYLWYVYVLFEYYLIMPGLLYLVKDRIEWLLVPTLALHFIYPMLPAYFAVDLLAKYAFVFILGGVFAKYYFDVVGIIQKYAWVFILVFAALLFSRVYGNTPDFVIGLMSLPAMYAVGAFTRLGKAPIWKTFGDYTFPIYLMNTIAIGAAKGIITKFIPWDGANFYFIAPVLLLAGVFLPIFVKKHFLKYIPPLDRIIV